MNASSSPVPGGEATGPEQIPARGWYQIAKRVFDQLGKDHVQLIAAGVAFYTFLAIFPALSALISAYGLVMTPAEVQSQVSVLTDILPPQARDLLSEVLVNLAATSDGTLGWSLFIGIALSIWSAKKGTNALFEGLNIVYNEDDTRSFLRRTGLTLLFTIGGFFAVAACLFLIVGISALVDKLGLPVFLEFLISLLRWPILAGLFMLGLTMAYKYAPHRSDPEFRWLTVGSITATVLWLALSYGFSTYVQNFGSYDETYGSLAAVVILLLWLFLTVLTILLGAEINAEMEHQTATDTTVGPDKPMGQRGAYYADTVPND